MNAIKPLAETEDTVTLSRADFEALLEELEDAQDLARLHEVQARIVAGEDEYLPIEMVKRLEGGANPVRVWREHRGLSATALAEAAGVSAAYLSEIETGKKPGSFAALHALARALGVDMEDLAPTPCDGTGG